MAPWIATLIACFGTDALPPAPVVAPSAPSEPTSPERRRGKRKGEGGRAEPSDPQARVPATGVPDPLRGLGDADLCRSDTLLMLKFSFDELQQGKCAEVCCAVDPEHGCCGLDWPSSDVMMCDEYAALRNGLFARHGYPFTEARWRDLFDGAPYYRRREDFDASWLSATAAANVEVLRRKEQARESCIVE